MITFNAVSKYLGYLVSVVAFIFGIILISGAAFNYVPAQMRVTAGIVMVLLGIYRFILTRTRARQQSEVEEE